MIKEKNGDKPIKKKRNRGNRSYNEEQEKKYERVNKGKERIHEMIN